MPKENIKIELTPEEAEMYKKYCQHHGLFVALLKGGVFDVKRGEVTLNFSDRGEIIDIWIRTLGYKKIKYVKQ